MEKNRKTMFNLYGDEAPRVKDFLIVFIVAALLIASTWIAYFKFGWLH